MSGDRITSGTPRDRISLTILGLALAPIIGAIASMFITLGFAALTSPIGPSISSLGNLLVGTVSIGAAFGWPAAIVLGAPLHVFLVKRGWTGAFHYLSSAAVIGLVTSIVALVLFSGLGGAGPIIAFMVILAGAVGGLVFWLIRRPDRDIAPAAPSKEKASS